MFKEDLEPQFAELAKNFSKEQLGIPLTTWAWGMFIAKVQNLFNISRIKGKPDERDTGKIGPDKEAPGAVRMGDAGETQEKEKTKGEQA